MVLYLVLHLIMKIKSVIQSVVRRYYVISFVARQRQPSMTVHEGLVHENYSTRRFVVCLSVCHLVLVFFSPFSIGITSLGEERELILVLFARLFSLCLFRSVGFLFLLGIWERLRFVIVALPGLFSYLFWVSAGLRSTMC